MKVVAINGKRSCEIVERPVPTPRENYVLVKILCAPMCTEVGDYRKGSIGEQLGHEAAGEVVEVARPGRFKVADRVVVMPQNGCGRCELCVAGEHIHCANPRSPSEVCGCTTGRATYAEYCIQQDWLLYPAPDGISIEHASMACCGLGPTFNAAERMNLCATDLLLVSGLGPVGLGAVINGIVRGAQVFGLESNPYRAGLALELGATAVFDPSDPELEHKVLECTRGKKFDKAIEASSAQDAPAKLVQLLRPGGHLASVGWGGPVRMADAVYRGLTIHGVWHWNHLRHGGKMARTLEMAQPLLDKSITHRFPLDRVKDAWELQLTGACGKVVLAPWG